MSYLDAVRAALASLEERSLRRSLRRTLPPGAIDLASNDYLGLARHPDVVAAFARASRVGSGGSRLLSGAHAEHAALEDELAAWTGREAALLFSSGYLAALGAIVTLAPVARHAYSHADNHACAIDALRLAKLPRTLYRGDALPPRATRETPALVVTESTFGMSGARADLHALVADLGEGDVAIVDEAHALGIVGPGGAGACAALADPRIVVVGTLSKALGGAGGFVAGPAEVIAFLATAARTFVFETAAPPALAAALRVSLALVRGDEGERRRTRLRANVATLRAALASHGIGVPQGDGPIVPLHVGDAAEALALGAALESAWVLRARDSAADRPAGARADPRDRTRRSHARGPARLRRRRRERAPRIRVSIALRHRNRYGRRQDARDGGAGARRARRGRTAHDRQARADGSGAGRAGRRRRSRQPGRMRVARMSPLSARRRSVVGRARRAAAAAAARGLWQTNSPRLPSPRSSKVRAERPFRSTPRKRSATPRRRRVAPRSSSSACASDA